MKIILFFNCIVLTALISCKGQSQKQIDSNENSIKVDTVKELGNNIMLVYQDKKNNYWFGSWETGLYQYDGKKILHFTTKSGLPNNRIDEIKEDHLGNIYFTTSDGIVKYDGKLMTILKESYIENYWNLTPTDLWFKDGWNSGSVFRYDGEFLHKLKLPKNKLGEDYISKNPTHSNPYAVYSIYKDSKGNIWFGTGAIGALRYNGKSFDWILEKDVVEIFNEPNEGSNGVRSIIEDMEGYFWFNSMFRYKVYENRIPSQNKLDSIFYSKEKSIGSLDGKKNGNLFEYLSIAKDNNDHLWIATYRDGVYQFDGRTIKHYTVKENSNPITLFSIYKDNFGNIWLGTHNSGAYKFNGQSFERFMP